MVQSWKFWELVRFENKLCSFTCKLADWLKTAIPERGGPPYPGNSSKQPYFLTVSQGLVKCPRKDSSLSRSWHAITYIVYPSYLINDTLTSNASNIVHINYLRMGIHWLKSWIKALVRRQNRLEKLPSPKPGRASHYKATIEIACV